MSDMKKLLGNFSFFVIVIIIVAKFSTIFTSVSFPLSTIVSDSMEPALHKGDIVPWIPCDIKDVKKGDIIVYKSMAYWNGKRYIVHRVDSIIMRNGKKLLITKGDANNYTDQAGPHVPEPPVNNEMLEGKLIMFGEKPIKLPYMGYPWLIASKFSRKMVAPIKWRSPQPGAHFMIFTPFLFFFSIFLTLIVLWIPNGKSINEKLHELIFGEARLPASRIILYTMAMFIPFLLFTSFFSFDHASLSESKETFVFNPSMIKVRAIAFFSDGNSINKKIFDIDSGEGETIKINGTGEIYVYSSPFWLFIPKGVMQFFYGINPKLCIITASLLSSFLLSFIASLLLIITSTLYDSYVRMKAYSTYATMYSKIKLLKLYSFAAFLSYLFKKSKTWFHDFSSWGEISKRTYYLVLLYLPFSFFLIDGLSNLFMISILSTIFVAFVAFLFNARSKNDAAFLSFSSSMLYSSIFVGKGMIYVEKYMVARFIQFLAVTTLLSLVLFIIMFSIILILFYIMRLIMEKVDPVTMIEVAA